MRFYYSQNREDLLIKSFFSDVNNGFYIDVGANDPVIDSVTKLFYDEGWHGINIDPIKKHIDNLNKQRPRDKNLCIGIGEKKEELLFTEYPGEDGLSTFDKSMRAVYKNSKNNYPTRKSKDYKVLVESLGEVFNEHEVEHVHFLKIDVEGYEYKVLAGYDFKNVRPELICIETSHIHRDWQPLLKDYDYNEVFYDGVNKYYLAKESLNRKKYFNYPNAVLSGTPVYFLAEQEIKQDAKKETEKIVKEREKIILNKISDQEQEIIFLQKQQRDVKFLVRRLNTEIQARLNRRANGFKQLRGLKYQNDPKLTSVLNGEKISKEEMLAFIHNRDNQNIKETKTLFRSYFKLFFWKLTSKVYGLMSKILKKMVAN